MTDKSNAYIWIWDNVNEVWVKALASSSGVVISCRCADDITTKRMTTIGLVALGARYIFWITLNPSDKVATMAITDAIIAGAEIKWDFLNKEFSSYHAIFDPPMPFTNGIYLESLVDMNSIIFAYI